MVVVEVAAIAAEALVTWTQRWPSHRKQEAHQCRRLKLLPYSQRPGKEASGSRRAWEKLKENREHIKLHMKFQTQLWAGNVWKWPKRASQSLWELNHGVDIPLPRLKTGPAGADVKWIQIALQRLWKINSCWNHIPQEADLNLWSNPTRLMGWVGEGLGKSNIGEHWRRFWEDH